MENPQPEPLVVPPEDAPISPPPTPDYDYVSEPPSPVFKVCADFILRNIGTSDVEEA